MGPAGRVVSFEPVPGPANDFEENIALNGYNHVRLIRAAASDQSGTATFDFSEDHASQGKLQAVEPTYQHKEATILKVKTLTLDSVLAAGERPPDILKIDVEGAAAAVLRGAAGILDRYGPVVYVELHGPEERGGVRDELLSRGYRAEALDGQLVADVVEAPADALWCVRDC